ncbi:transmembrane protease serine 3, partial [Oryzias latipes]|uniref:transmembrane protease serine 3 n=1 Tax=Oryzias latipes TaxID=8090 RepID=UPI000CE19D35
CSCSADNDVEKSWRSRLFPHRLELLVAACLLLAVAFFFSVGLGVGLSCVGRFRCGSSQKCVASSARCDGAADCPNQEDELGCVRLSGRRSVLQVQRRGEWRTVCADNWNNSLGLSACKQLGYSRYVESSFVPQNSIEEDLQSSLVSLDTTQSDVIKLQSAAAFRYADRQDKGESQCSSGMVTTLKCLECGSRPRYQTRVVGGNLSLPGQFPWQASLHFRGEHMCGGSVISPLWIVTAAHCVYGFSNSSLWKVYVGLTEQPIHAAQSLAVRKIVYHARYRSRSLDYDIALMRLDQPLTFNGLVEPICLPNHGEDFQEDTKCWISGWGATEEDGESSVVLRAAVVPLISTRTCNQPEVYAGHISSWMICAGYLEGGVDSCQGDSGGPLACHDPSAWKLVGATSWGEGCAARNRPGVYTRVTTALSWIRKQMEVSAEGGHEGGSKVVQRTDRVSSEPSRTMTLQSSADPPTAEIWGFWCEFVEP